MGKWVHRLTDVDHENRTATCANCGPVLLRYESGRRPVCAVAKRARSSGYSKQPHGLTAAEARAFRDGKACAICGRPGQAVDHDHATGVIRDVLCHACNQGLGCFRDDPSRLRLAAEYLERHRAPDSRAGS